LDDEDRPIDPEDIGCEACMTDAELALWDGSGSWGDVDDYYNTLWDEDD
jgi:hypothetical protein